MTKAGLKRGSPSGDRIEMGSARCENRRQILDLLRDDERTVTELFAALDLSQPGVSKHLRILCEGRLVDVHPAGVNVGTGRARSRSRRSTTGSSRIGVLV